MEVPWAQFANVFHMHFINATRQDITRPARSLHFTEIGYLQEKFFNNKATITVKVLYLFVFDTLANIWEYHFFLFRILMHFGNGLGKGCTC